LIDDSESINPFQSSSPAVELHTESPSRENSSIEDVACVIRKRRRKWIGRKHINGTLLWKGALVVCKCRKMTREAVPSRNTEQKEFIMCTSVEENVQD